MKGRAVYVAGVAESPLGKVPDHSELSMMAVAAREALAEAGLRLRDVDGLFVRYRSSEPLVEPTVEFGEYVGIRPRYADSTDIGGGSFEAYVHHALAAVATGRCEVALLAHASRQRSRRSRSMLAPADDYTLSGQFEAPYGLPSPIGQYALIAARHMHEFGTTEEQLAEVAVAARQWAQLNPKAWERGPLTVADVLASEMVSSPLKRLDCCLITDGGAAVVVTTRERARDAVKRPVRVLGASESHSHWHIAQMPDLTASPGGASARDAFAMAGVRPQDVDLVEPYDNFTSTVIMHLEDLGFCQRGEGGPFVADGRLGPGGDLPAMTSGGGLSYNHPGMLGLLLLVEAVRQLRGEAGARQVPQARLGVVHGIGGISFGAAATVVLGRE
ncbi:MAG TPA: acetyl-CoA acetyltransferase [Methylomirabilota bacterium]|jgi:acetyl-CoA acetyltransferase|nr:acetyl-CoA acetyltransferase [Methylomirabilota bacterium]